MSESTLNTAFYELQGRTGFFLGFDRGPHQGGQDWDEDSQYSIDQCVKGGLRKFYHCGYDWSFLHPMASMSLAANQAVLALPDDYGGVEGRMVIVPPSGTAYEEIDFGPVGRVYQRTAEFPSEVSRPKYCCAEPIKGTGMTQGQRYQLRFWPMPDQAYTIQFPYYINPNYLSGSFPYAYGGPEHAETLLEACLSVAELVLDDAATVHAQEFQKLLAVSQQLDRRKKPTNLGYCGDNSDAAWRQRYPRWDDYIVTFNGVHS